jgi:hypothetical protein
MGVQKHYKKRFTKNLVEKLLQKIDKKVSNRFFLDFFNHVFGLFRLVGGVQKRQKISEKNLPALVLFWPPRNQPTT